MKKEIKIGIGIIIFSIPFIWVGVQRGLDLLVSKYTIMPTPLFLFALAICLVGIWLMWEGYKGLKRGK